MSYGHFICIFASGNCGKEGKILQKFEYLQNEKSFLDEKKAFLVVFEVLSFAEKNKNSRHFKAFKVVDLLP